MNEECMQKRVKVEQDEQDAVYGQQWMATFRQQLHHVRVDGEHVMVKVLDTPPELESDRYYTEPYRIFMENSLKELDSDQMNAVRVPIHSTRTGLAPALSKRPHHPPPNK